MEEIKQEKELIIKNGSDNDDQNKTYSEKSGNLVYNFQIEEEISPPDGTKISVKLYPNSSYKGFKSSLNKQVLQMLSKSYTF